MIIIAIIMVKISINNSNNDSDAAINDYDVNGTSISNSFSNSNNICGVNSYDGIESNNIDDSSLQLC